MSRAQGRSQAHGQDGAPRRVPAHPLESLVFLLPLILFYEIGSLRLGPALELGRQDRVVAFQLLRTFFELFGPTGRWMPVLAVVAILLGAQLASRRRWRVRLGGIGWLYVESALWAVPLLGLSRVFVLQASDGLAGGLWSDLVLCVGAGIYEELVFRLILVCLLVMVFSDVMGWPGTWTTLVAVGISAVLFAAHHHPPMGSEPFELGRFVFRAMAGVFLGGLFVYRGYGVAAGTHVAYNVLVVGLAG
ncbi:MAG: type II CAAX prenyl endopeptidase Rce1 family protein [Phycisphaerae bacterium]